VGPVWFGLVSALFSAVCYGCASTLQAIAARATADDRRGVDPRLLVRLLGQWRYLAGLALDLTGLVAQVTALRTLPLFLVQACQAAAIPVTALLAVRVFRARLSAVEWTAIALVCAGLSLLGAAARSEGAGHGPGAAHWVLLAATVVLLLLGLAAGQLPGRARDVALGLISGLGFGAVGIAARIIPSLAPLDLLRDPATYAVVVAGITGAWFYASALQRGGVVAATAMNLLGETIPPALVGVLLLGDETRPGWTPAGAAGFVLALAGAVVLARFGQIETAAPPRAAATGAHP
jgi:drug/metabolite transporter (DMT)-like permease